MASKGVLLKDLDSNNIYPCPYFPVGSIYMSVNSTNPSTYFGGTWERIKGKFLLGADDSIYKVGATGGEAAHQLTTSEIPAHTHGSKSLTGGYYSYDYVGSRANGIISETVANENGTGFGADPTQTPWKEFSINATHEHSSVGGNTAHNNMPPYLAVYI